MSSRPSKPSKGGSSSGGGGAAASTTSAAAAATATTTATTATTAAAPVVGPALPPPPKPQRTIQVKIGSQAPKTMTPDQAAEYLKSIAGKGGFGGAREVKMTFGTGGGGGLGGGGGSIGSSSGAAATSSGRSGASKTATAASKAASGSSSASAAATTAAGTASGGAIPSSGGGGTSRRKANKDGMPCSEKEMKALMSMFVEIMGLQMNVDKLNAAKRTAGGDSATSSSATISTTTGNANVNNSDDPNDPSNENDSLPDLESATTTTAATASSSSSSSGASGGAALPMPPLFPFSSAAAGISSLPLGVPSSAVTGAAGIPPFEWEALERVAIEDALEQEERARKSHGRSAAAANGGGKDSKDGGGKAKGYFGGSGSGGGYPPFYPAAATYSTGGTGRAGGTGIGGTSFGSGGGSSSAFAPCDSAEAMANKKHQKAVQAWKAQVIAAVQGSTVDKLGKCLHESPLRVEKSSADRAVMNQLAPYCVGSKNRKRKDSRDALTEFIAKHHPLSLVVEPTRNGRPVVHTLCYEADIDLLGSILPSIPEADLSATCSDSGLTPLMYACLSGSVACMELLLANKADFRDVTNPNHTWQKDDVGLTCRQLLECLLNAKHCKSMETHGMALDEVQKRIASSQEYAATLEHMVSRLQRIESGGYSPRSQQEIANEVAKIKARAREEKAAVPAKPKQGPARERLTDESSENDDEKEPSETGEDESKQETVTSSSVENETSSVAKSSPPKDPLITALIGMGFSEPEIMKGVRACGGLDRATADNVVAWIFGGQEPTESPSVEPESSVSTAKSSVERSQASNPMSSKQQKTRTKRQTDIKQLDAARKAEEERIAAEKLAAKREEQRRRNREWNSRAQVRQQQEDQAKISKAAVSAGESVGVSSNPVPVAMAPPAASYFPQPPSGPASAPRLKTGVLGLTSAHVSAYGAGNGPTLHSNDGATIASSIDVEFGNDDATVSTLGSLQTRATPIPFGSQPPKIASQVVPPGFNQYQLPPEQRSMPAESLLASTGVPAQPASFSSMPPPGLPESDPRIVEARRLPSSAFSGHAFGMLNTSITESLSGRSSELVSSGLLGSLQQTSGTALADHSSLFSTGMTHHAPSPVPALPMPPGYGVSRMQSAPASFTAAGARTSAASHLSATSMSIPPPSLVEAATMGSHVRSHPTGALGFGLDAHPSLGRPHAVQQPLQHHTLDTSIIESISTGSTDLTGASLWGRNNPHGAPSISGTSLLGSLISSSNSESAEPSSLFANPPVHHHSQEHQSQLLNEGLWGSSSSSFQNAPGGGSIW